MAREFSVSGGGLTIVSGPVTLVFINPPASPNFNIAIIRAWASQSGSTTSAQCRIQIMTQVSAFPTLVSATPAKLKRADPNASIIVGGTAGAAGTSGINASAQGAGAQTVVFDDAFNVLNGWLWVPTPAEEIVVPAGSLSGIGLLIPATAPSLTGWSFGMNFREC